MAWWLRKTVKGGRGHAQQPARNLAAFCMIGWAEAGSFRTSVRRAKSKMKRDRVYHHPAG
ncbi:MAG: hypothetical protein CVU71_08495 [Deltaproteobacteria bacterium HGW-Deltaproteobacteria-6]|nr:MAG: hypothetical protein CVU71_08495 [Deltaproteobacteria bacterium HGW-Deltaproteobacteria-6]